MDICLENMILEARTILEFFGIAGKKQTQGSGRSRNKMSSAHRRMTGCTSLHGVRDVVVNWIMDNDTGRDLNVMSWKQEALRA
jgi:hypothetical protein